MATQINNNTNTSGIGFVGLLTILFIALKLTNVIDWSWWWVLSPLWICASIWVFVILVLLLIAAAASRKV